MAKLKDVFLKAGIVTQKQVQKMEAADRHQKVVKRKKETEGRKDQEITRQKEEKKHVHHVRTACDACGKSSSDVEFYRHKNRSLDKYWLCLKCADENSIHDQYRETAQSFNIKQGLFIRQYGPTIHSRGKS